MSRAGFVRKAVAAAVWPSALRSVTDTPLLAQEAAAAPPGP